uniref:Uncharacterized protein n=1 Tax=Sphaerodactylus townsendi TaxID=933632 RepID=A0ACB8EQG8_9SAUR
MTGLQDKEEPYETKEREALLSCIYNFTGVCVASDYPDIWKHTANLLEASCGGDIRPKVDNLWNGTVTHKGSNKCNNQRKKIIANQKCGNHTLQELQIMWKYYYQM